MTIAKGTNWGTIAPFPDGAPTASTNAELRRLVESGARLVGLLGGDLHRTAGGLAAGGRLLRNDPDNLPAHLSVDVVDISVDGRSAGSFAAHLIGHDVRWTRVIAAMNADFWRRYQLGPHAHPNDGVIDVYDARFSVADLMRVQARARSGTHVPHPAIALTRAASVTLTLDRRVRLRADDLPVPRGHLLDLTVRPDALTVVV
jgi:hypothetical protein